MLGFKTLQKHTHCMQAAHVHACNTLVHPNTLKTNADDHKQSTPPPHTRIWAPSGPTHLPLPSGNKSQFTKTQNLQKKHGNIPKLTSGPFHGQSTCPGPLHLTQEHTHAHTHTTHIHCMLKLLTEIQNKDGAHLNTSAHVRFQNPTKTHTLHASSTRACLQHSSAPKHTQNKRR